MAATSGVICGRVPPVDGWPKLAEVVLVVRQDVRVFEYVKCPVIRSRRGCGRLWAPRSGVQGSVGAVCAPTGPAASTAGLRRGWLRQRLTRRGVPSQHVRAIRDAHRVIAVFMHEHATPHEM